MRGRPPIPTALKIVRGNPGKRPLPKDEPKPPEVNPAKPKRVVKDEEASGEWDRLVALTTAKNARVLTVADGPMLEATARAFSEYQSACEAVAENGLTYETTTPTGAIMVRPRPEVAMRNDAWRRYVSGLTHFGLSPMTRTKVKTGDVEGDDLEAWQRKRRPDRGRS